MLRLEKMEMVGFKSFSDRTEVIFPDGITGVVGPNGCGKSNIGDAINWVLGEQSAKMLRGSSMEDVIFNGSDGRRPMGMAEVSLHLAATNGAPERREVVLTRRLFRSGESEYLVNGRKSRLKDIQDLLREARIGAKTYATIEQGRIEQILNAKPKERRLILEEAAGIAGFKQKRRLTELKLDATQANLLRVNDIIGEVRRQINALKRQAAKARRYRRLRDELRGKEGIRFGLKARLLDQQLRAVREEEAGARSAEAAAGARQSALEASLAAERQAVEEAGRSIHEAREDLHRLDIRINEEETQVRSCRERMGEGDQSAARLQAESASLAARKSLVEDEARAHEASVDLAQRQLGEMSARLLRRQSELDGAETRLLQAREAVESLRRGLFESMNRAAEERNQRRSLEEARERALSQQARRTAEREATRGDLTRLEDEALRVREEEAEQSGILKRLDSEHAALNERLGGARSRLAAETEALAQAREREKSATARLRTLEDVATRFAGVSDGVKVLLTSGPSAGVRTLGVVADYVEAGDDVEAAAELYLQGLLPAVILENDADAHGAAALLRSRGGGRASFLCRDHPGGSPAVGTPSNGRTPFPQKVLEDPRVLGRLRDRLKLKGANGFLSDRIGDAVLVDNLESALALHRAHPHADYLTPAGEVVYASGLVAAGGKKASDHGLLAHARRTQQARAEQREATTRVADHQARVEEVRVEVARLEEVLADERQKLEEGRRRLVELGLRVERSSEESRRTGRTAEILAEEVSALIEEARGLEDQLVVACQKVVSAERSHEEIEEELRSRSGALEENEGEVRRLAEETAVLRAEVAVHGQSQAAAERERERYREEIGDLVARIEATVSEAAAGRARALQAAELLGTTEGDLLRHLREREDLAAKVLGQEKAESDQRATLKEREESQKGVRAELEATRELVRQAELGRARAEADRQHLDDLCFQELGLAAAEAAAKAGEALDGAEPQALEVEIVDLKGRIEKIGPVNMMAIEEFTELEQRHSFLVAQQQDLEQSMASLRETIRRINGTSREQFLKAFEAVRASYQEIFRLLFGGGRADLKLEEGEDVLECGVEILAQPPGKRLESVQLLSGGEKAMAAIALLFAIFRYQPSPFCLLDEVDAALDDVNVNRFTRMLREYSGSTQFVIITHNKLSMDAANLLYGVTMEEPGVSRVMSLQLD